MRTNWRCERCKLEVNMNSKYAEDASRRHQVDFHGAPDDDLNPEPWWEVVLACGAVLVWGMSIIVMAFVE